MKKTLKNLLGCYVYTKKAKSFPRYDFSGELGRFEKKITSQNGEDGIIHAIFQDIGTTDKTFCEFGYGILENNSIQLIQRGWQGLYIDSEMHFSEMMRLLLLKKGVRVIREFLTKENINSAIGRYLQGEIDFLSIDIDGNDYWLWRAIDVIDPRVVCIEYNASFGADRSITIPYIPDFQRHNYHESGFYGGASLRALEKLGKEKGYELVYVEDSGVNSFFVKKNCLISIKGEDAKYFFKPHKDRMGRGYSNLEQLNLIRNLPIVEV